VNISFTPLSPSGGPVNAGPVTEGHPDHEACTTADSALVRFRRDRRQSAPGDVTTAEDVAYFRDLVARLEGGCGCDGVLWDLPCARLALAALERRLATLQQTC